MIEKIRKPKVEEVSAFDDTFAVANLRKEEDPYAGKSFAEVLRMKREKLEAQLKSATIETSAAAEAKGAAGQE